ncbi:MAG: FumA C-terminus/TtdB family hydratase beta subunit [Candidatus Omnitrophica bacterium]|nr:FumA C-terminus/TtdB family hydratase beta subunit [Candidatus Omnitrophota bacterium]MBU2045088.1 FumA C-terminus/TtdB family hydratase beta subunit [Candidatus Omnitrophota bacterium]MBU2251211.1 FumA C-terminus/TtdB family hydratase beta subunit [Candidatus Omnitrophota bacterium]MBU2473175.1 FumA C-terminus/TtdB family hydratase beta subunit [Candidatus Omnitrophota bacterium]
MNIKSLKSGQEILFSGVIYTARDQAHKRLVDIINNAGAQNFVPLPFDLKGQFIYYCGPTATPKNKVIGSCGPTTSSRMDEFVEPLLKKGLLGMIGKGRRSKKVRNLIKKYKAVYLLAPAGCGALLAKKVLSKKLVAFKDLGPEAIYRLEVKDFPVIVGIDSLGKDTYEDLCD